MEDETPALSRSVRRVSTDESPMDVDIAPNDAAPLVEHSRLTLPKTIHVPLPAHIAQSDLLRLHPPRIVRSGDDPSQWSVVLHPLLVKGMDYVEVAFDISGGREARMEASGLPVSEESFIGQGAVVEREDLSQLATPSPREAKSKQTDARSATAMLNGHRKGDTRAPERGIKSIGERMVETKQAEVSGEDATVAVTTGQPDGEHEQQAETEADLITVLTADRAESRPEQRPIKRKPFRATSSTSPKPSALLHEPPSDATCLCEPSMYIIASGWRTTRDRLYKKRQSGQKLTLSDQYQCALANRWVTAIGRARRHADDKELRWPPVALSKVKKAGSTPQAIDIAGESARVGQAKVKVKKEANAVSDAGSSSLSSVSDAEQPRFTSPIRSHRKRKVPHYHESYDLEEIDLRGRVNATAGPSRLPKVEREPVVIAEGDTTADHIHGVNDLLFTQASSRTPKRPRNPDDGDSTFGKTKKSKTPREAKPRSKARPVFGPHLPGPTEMIQVGRCHQRRYKEFPMCTSCIGKTTGDGCRFEGFRVFPLDTDSGEINGKPWWTDRQDAVGEDLEFPDHYNVGLSDAHKYRTQKCVAAALLPVITREWLHAAVNNSKHKPVKVKDRVTCDFCSTSVFGGTWFCTVCGKEYCLDCRSYFVDTAGCDVSKEDNGTQAQKLPEGNDVILPEGTDAALLNEDAAPLLKGNPTLLAVDSPRVITAKSAMRLAIHGLDPDAAARLSRCSHGRYHSVTNLLPVTRWTRSQVYHAWLEILQMAIQSGADVTNQLEGVPWDHVALLDKLEDVHRLRSTALIDRGPGQNEDARRAAAVAAITLRLDEYRSTTTGASDTPQPDDPAQLCTHAFFRTSVSTSDNDLFDAMWAHGVPLVVDDVLPRFKLDWSPEAFVQRAKNETCPIIDCQTHIEQSMRVADFFRMYRTDPMERRLQVLKLRDWPTTTEFRLQFPDLFEDFSNALPFPDYTRRDGVLNVTSHFPANSACPDIGPKMYNAFAGVEGAGGYGSTRLHMDMADAINVLMHANPRRDGTPGCACWDIYRAEDADTIRTFLRRKAVGEKFTDPIHSQVFFLDSAQRRQLFDETGVYSYRIYQYPGQAVYIPAGCAHQVCNLSDCIKIACDFVSPHNVERCAKLTREFRDENLLKMRAWKADVLQLNNTTWYAWLSCKSHAERLATYPARQQAKFNNEFAIAEASKAFKQLRASSRRHPTTIQHPNEPDEALQSARDDTGIASVKAEQSGPAFGNNDIEMTGPSPAEPRDTWEAVIEPSFSLPAATLEPTIAHQAEISSSDAAPVAITAVPASPSHCEPVSAVLGEHTQDAPDVYLGALTRGSQDAAVVAATLLSLSASNRFEPSSASHQPPRPLEAQPEAPIHHGHSPFVFAYANPSMNGTSPLPWRHLAPHVAHDHSRIAGHLQIDGYINAPKEEARPVTFSGAGT